MAETLTEYMVRCNCPDRCSFTSAWEHVESTLEHAKEYAHKNHFINPTYFQRTVTYGRWLKHEAK